jgi:2-polyprenyl-3-methyl-5-hydroxy-6-metoxy-1,4-benzoquinol methylase
MARIRLRESRSADDEAAYYARVYPDGYRHDRWADHVERVKASADMIERYAGQIRSAADLSCGDGALLNMISRHLTRAVLGDLNGVPASAAVSCKARVLETIGAAALPDSLTHMEPVDLFILSETLEHINDPDDLLARLTDHARYLFLSTPVAESADSGNLEHYWSWGVADVHEMLLAAGWTPLEQHTLRPESTRDLPGAYRYQLWLAVKR